MARKGKIMAHTEKLLSLVDQFPQAFGSVEPLMSSTSEVEVEPSIREEQPLDTGGEHRSDLEASSAPVKDPVASSNEVPQATQSTPPEGPVSPVTAVEKASPGVQEQATPADPPPVRTPLQIVSSKSQAPAAQEQQTVRQRPKVVPLQRQKSRRPSTHLLSLMQEFPQAFAQDPMTAAVVTPVAETSVEVEAPSSQAAIEPQQAAIEPQLATVSTPDHQNSPASTDRQVFDAEESAAQIAAETPVDAEPAGFATPHLDKPTSMDVPTVEEPSSAELLADQSSDAEADEAANAEADESFDAEADEAANAEAAMLDPLPIPSPSAQAEDAVESALLSDAADDQTNTVDSAATAHDRPEQEPETPQPLSQSYDRALQRHIPTFTWGEVQVYFTYGDSSLRSMWITVGKSGTEVQSLCEAIARLINLLLSRQVPIPEICRQIRGIRGADSEGLGPNRILGLADLIGKALQEAPETLAAAEGESAQDVGVAIAPLPEATDISTSPSIGTSSGDVDDATTLTEPPVQAGSQASTWTIPEQGNLTAMLCPECGAELQHMNGCSGGACHVCGYSSCS
jgi:hypothetical protein